MDRGHISVLKVEPTRRYRKKGRRETALPLLGAGVVESIGAPPRLQNNVRSEIQHMMMVMFLAVKIRIASALLGGPLARGGGIQLGVGLENRDLWECILYLRRQLRAKRILLKVFSTTEGTRRTGPGWSVGIRQL